MWWGGENDKWWKMFQKLTRLQVRIFILNSSSKLEKRIDENKYLLKLFREWMNWDVSLWVRLGNNKK